MSSRRPSSKHIGTGWFSGLLNSIDVPTFLVNIDKLRRFIPNLVYLYKHLHMNEPHIGFRILRFFEKIHVLDLINHTPGTMVEGKPGTFRVTKYVLYECSEGDCTIFKLNKDNLPIAISSVHKDKINWDVSVPFNVETYASIVAKTAKKVKETSRQWWYLLIWLNEAEELYRLGTLLMMPSNDISKPN